MENQNLQQTFIDSSAQANNITCIHLAKKKKKNRNMIKGLVDTFKSIGNTSNNNHSGHK